MIKNINSTYFREQKNLLKSLLALGCLGLLTIFFFATGRSQGLEKRLDTINLKGQTIAGPNLGDILAKIAKNYEIPVGFVVRTPDSLTYVDESEITAIDSSKADVMVPHDGTLREVLDELTRLYPAYSWAVDDETIYVSPTIEKDEDLNEILNVKINGAEIKYGNGLTSLGFSVVEIAEVKNRLKGLGLVTFMARTHDNGEKEYSLDIKDKYLKDVLNDVIKNGPFKFWSISKSITETEIKVLVLTTM